MKIKIILFTIILMFCNILNANISIGKEQYYNHLFYKYGKKYQIPPTLLWAIAKTESKFNEKAFNNSNTNGSEDRGLMQVNSIHEDKLKARNLKLDDLYDPDINIEIGAMILKNCLKRYGMNYKALNCYNGRVKNNPYSNRVIKNLKTFLVNRKVVK